MVSTAVSLCWVYLVTFQQSCFPERQQIDLRIDSAPAGHIMRSERFPPLRSLAWKAHGPPPSDSNYLYTGRTWGADIENLLRDHIKSLFLSDNSSYRTFVKNWYKYIRAFMFVLIAIVMTAVTIGALRLFDQVAGPYHRIPLLGLPDSERLSKTVDFMAETMLGIRLPLYMLVSFMWLISAVIISAWIVDKSVRREAFELPSFVLLTRRTEDVKRVRMHKYEHNWRTFTASFAVAVVASVVANVMMFLFSK